MIKRDATAVWRGNGKQGQGNLTTQSGTLKNTQYSFTTRFENGIGTNPEELIAAAHAGCFTMALAFQLEGAGVKADEMTTKATVQMDKQEIGWTITEIKLDLMAKIPNVTNEVFTELANKAKAGCPISRV